MWVFDPLVPHGVTIYNVIRYCLATTIEELLPCFVLNVFLCLCCAIKSSKLGIYLHNAKIWVNVLSKCWYLTPHPHPGVTIYRVIRYCLAINIEELLPCFVLNVFCAYFVHSNRPNWEFIDIILIFGVILGQNLGIWPPGVTIYRVTPYCLAINIEELLSCFVLKKFCGYFTL